jgi:hypothetical protein
VKRVHQLFATKAGHARQGREPTLGIAAFLTFSKTVFLLVLAKGGGDHSGHARDALQELRLHGYGAVLDSNLGWCLHPSIDPSPPGGAAAPPQRG